MITVATAGWSIPKVCRRDFTGDGSQLSRYAQVWNGVEINTSAYRVHAEQTFRRWARQVPRRFRFSVKLPQLITHELALRNARRPLKGFLDTVAGLGTRLGPLLVQLPPSLEFNPRATRRFFLLLREMHAGTVACEPRHPSWFDQRADRLLMEFQVARVAADPAVVPAAATPGGWPGLAYWRLHGSPRKYFSSYPVSELESWSDAASKRPRRVPQWFVFDNTASGAAMANALEFAALLRRAR